MHLQTLVSVVVIAFLAPAFSDPIKTIHTVAQPFEDEASLLEDEIDLMFEDGENNENYEKIENEACSASAYYTYRASSGCDGWQGVTPEECMRKCTFNEVPNQSCPQHVKDATCQLIKYNKKKSGWCQLGAAVNCSRSVDPDFDTYVKKDSKCSRANPCGHNGWCNEDGVCKCPRGVTGTMCETKVEDFYMSCSSNPCQRYKGAKSKCFDVECEQGGSSCIKCVTETPTSTPRTATVHATGHKHSTGGWSEQEGTEAWTEEWGIGAWTGGWGTKIPATDGHEGHGHGASTGGWGIGAWTGGWGTQRPATEGHEGHGHGASTGGWGIGAWTGREGTQRPGIEEGDKKDHAEIMITIKMSVGKMGKMIQKIRKYFF